jgi:hypothetical protein
MHLLLTSVDTAIITVRCRTATVVLAFACASGACGIAHALEPAAVEAGPLRLEPTVTVDMSWVDNLYRSGRSEVDSWILRTSPAVRAYTQHDTNEYSLLYAVDDGRYGGTPGGEDDDYTDHRLRGEIHHEFNARNQLNAQAQFHRTHEERGTGLTEGGLNRLTDSPVEYEVTELGGEYTFGNWETAGRLELAANARQYEYRNYRDFTRYFDYDRDDYRGTLYWNLGGRTALLAEAGYLQADYRYQRPEQPALDAEELRLLAGVTWQAGGKTRGTVKLGGFARDFSAAERGSAEGYAWDINVNYRRKSYSILDFNARQVSRETNGLGDFINSHEVVVNWLHVFTRGYRSNARLELAADEYSGSPRDDERFAVELTLERQMRRWLELGIGWRYEDRDSSQDLFSYSRNGFFGTVVLSL